MNERMSTSLSNFREDPVERLVLLAESLLQRLEAVLPPASLEPDWSAPAFRWRTRPGHANRGWLEAVHYPHKVGFEDLHGIDEQKERIQQNTRQFVRGDRANNVLLTGARGTGKSSLVKAALSEFSSEGLRLIEVEKEDLISLPEIVALVENRPERFIIFCDDLSFEVGEPGYKAMKSILDGSISGVPENLLVYATSNRRHLMPENMSENMETRHGSDGAIHPGETTEEKVSLSDRFGLWLSFYPISQEQYLTICEHWLMHFGLDKDLTREAHQEALIWALTRGSRSGRVAWQFARDYSGRTKKERK